MWTNEKLEEAKQLWQAGESASAIADKVGAVSRSAVLGLFYRHGLSRSVNIGARNRSMKHRADRERIKRAAKRAEAKAPELKPLAPKFSPEPLPPLEPVTMRRTFEQLGPDECKWPVGDPREEGFGFCGLPKPAGKPYCLDCQRRASNGVPAKVVNGFAMRGAVNRLGLG